MDNEIVSSGFIDTDQASGSLSFTDIQEVYVSVSGYARLFRCRRYNRLHMLKALKPEYAGNAFFEQALRKEFDIGYRLEHPHVCRALGWETLPELGHCIVLEYIDGITLREFMEQNRLTSELARKFVEELCGALGYLHGKQIVHRDLKPENILVTYNGNNIKLIDFGLSDCDDYDVLKQPAGTRYYLAPEALNPGQPLDLRADIYSLGIIVGEMAEKLKDKQLAAISRKCTRQRPSDRYASAMLVVRDLEARPVGHRISSWVAFVAVLLVVSGSTAAYFYHQAEQAPMEFPAYGNYSLSAGYWTEWADSTVREAIMTAEFPLEVQRRAATGVRYRQMLEQWGTPLNHDGSETGR